jgi:SAM-dependent methyltransferase
MTRYLSKWREREFFRTLGSFSRAHLLQIGIRMDLFAALRQPKTAKQLAKDSHLAPDLLQTWLRAAASHGLIRMVRERDRAYQIDGLAKWLLETPDSAPLIALLEEAIEGYGPLFERMPNLFREDARPEFGSSAESRRTAEISQLVERQALSALGRIPGVRDARRLLDVGCGYGGYLVGMLRRYRDAHGVGIEQNAEVAEIAVRNVKAADLSRRCEIRVGEFMSLDLAAGSYDLILLNNNLHYFAPNTHSALFDRIFSRLVPGGILAIQTAVVSERAAARLMGLSANSAVFDLYLRAHDNLYGLPDLGELHASLLAVGFETVAEVAFLPGGAARYIWARAPRGQERDPGTGSRDAA